MYKLVMTQRLIHQAMLQSQMCIRDRGEDYYEGNLSEGQADLQPGESIAVAIPEGMKEGEYQLSIVSCGNPPAPGTAP